MACFVDSCESEVCALFYLAVGYAVGCADVGVSGVCEAGGVDFVGDCFVADPVALRSVSGLWFEKSDGALTDIVSVAIELHHVYALVDKFLAIFHRPLKSVIITSITEC